MTGSEKEGRHIGCVSSLHYQRTSRDPRPISRLKDRLSHRNQSLQLGQKKNTSAAAPTADTEIETEPQEYSSTPKGHVLHMTFFGPQFSVTAIASLWCILISLVLTVWSWELRFRGGQAKAQSPVCQHCVRGSSHGHFLRRLLRDTEREVSLIAQSNI